jgi:hypothetical protein
MDELPDGWRHVEMEDATSFETPTGGQVIIGRCTKSEDHLILFAHVDLADASALADCIKTACLRLAKEVGSA